jgi:hypothetical protein
MATFRVRFKLNPGRTGIALGKLSKQAENIELFLRSLAADVGEDEAPNLWIAKDFKNGSVYSTAEYQAVVDADRASKFNSGIESLSKYKSKPNTRVPDFVSTATIDRFASLRQSLDADENIGIAVFDVETGKIRRWSYLDRLQLEEIGLSVEAEVKYVGAIIGRTYQWNKGAADPYIIIRELNTGELVKCIYSDDDYSKVAKIFASKSAVVIIQGRATYNRITGKTEITLAQDFDFAPEFSDSDFEQFFGCAPNLTGNLSTSDFIAMGRDDA